MRSWNSLRCHKLELDDSETTWIFTRLPSDKDALLLITTETYHLFPSFGGHSISESSGLSKFFYKNDLMEKVKDLYLRRDSL